MRFIISNLRVVEREIADRKVHFSTTSILERLTLLSHFLIHAYLAPPHRFSHLFITVTPMSISLTDITMSALPSLSNWSTGTEDDINIIQDCYVSLTNLILSPLMLCGVHVLPAAARCLFILVAYIRFAWLTLFFLVCIFSSTSLESQCENKGGRERWHCCYNDAHHHIIYKTHKASSKSTTSISMLLYVAYFAFHFIPFHSFINSRLCLSPSSHFAHKMYNAYCAYITQCPNCGNGTCTNFLPRLSRFISNRKVTAQLTPFPPPPLPSPLSPSSQPLPKPPSFRLPSRTSAKFSS